MRFERDNLPKPATARARSLRRRMTWSEKRLWQELKKLDANVRRQVPIGRYFADFAAHGSKLVIEVDGGVHERLDAVALRDAERQRWLEGEGYAVLRFTDRQLDDDIEGCVGVVRQALGLPPPEDEMRREVVAWVTAADERVRAPTRASCAHTLHTPPSPALPPSRRKGAS